MLRLKGITFPDEKRIEVALTYIYGVGSQTSKKILRSLNIDLDRKVKDISEEEEVRLRETLQQYILEGDLRRQVQLNIKRLQDIGSYRGVRHRKGYPVRGQRTKTNARTRKGRRRTVANKKLATK